MGRGAKLAADRDRLSSFEKMGHQVSYESEEALERAAVVIDCTPAGNQNKEDFYDKLTGPRGFLAQGSEYGFGKPYARGINSIQLYFDGERWWITSWVFDSEREGNEIPGEYLPGR